MSQKEAMLAAHYNSCLYPGQTPLCMTLVTAMCSKGLLYLTATHQACTACEQGNTFRPPGTHLGEEGVGLVVGGQDVLVLLLLELTQCTRVLVLVGLPVAVSMTMLPISSHTHLQQGDRCADTQAHSNEVQASICCRPLSFMPYVHTEPRLMLLC